MDASATSSSASGDPAEARRICRAAERRYLIGMGSLTLVDLGITGIFLVISGQLAAATQAAVANVLILGVLNVVGARLIFRSITRAAETGAPANRVVGLLRQLPGRSAVWVALMTIVYVAAAFGSGRLITSDATGALSSSILAAASVWYTLVYVVLYASYALFFAHDVAGRTRALFAQQLGLEAAPTQERYAARLFGVFGLVGGLPAALIAADLTVFAPFRAAQGLDTAEAVLLDILAGGFALGVALVFAARNLTKPVARLDAAIAAAAGGGAAYAAVSSDDEIGRLTARFNRMIAERRAAQREVEYLAKYDPLTGALNRAGLIAALKAGARGADRFVAVVDIVDFQAVNDGLGLQVGNDVLRAVHRRLTTAFPDLPVARLYGDIFAVATSAGAPRTADDLAQALCALFDAPFAVDGARVRLYPAFGAAALDAAVEPETLLQRAVMAKKSVKTGAPGRLALYDARLQDGVARRQAIAAGLQNALRRDELAVHYQPIVSLQSLRAVGFEALMRWTQDGAPRSPAEFIPVAEASGLILDLGDWLIRSVIRDLRAFTADAPDVYAAINFSGRQIEEGGAMRTILDELKAADLPVGAASIEVTESLAMDDGAFPVAAHLRSLREAGLKLSLDDFGTGHSSLVRLKDIPVSQIKIDRSFITDMERNDRRRAIVRNVIALAVDLGLDVVAEGVENEA
ncbi:MAG: bifunctional diguanylate cyclase/phosphodiesterase, partial [Pseudomonadota bacterium]